MSHQNAVEKKMMQLINELFVLYRRNLLTVDRLEECRMVLLDSKDLVPELSRMELHSRAHDSLTAIGSLQEILQMNFTELKKKGLSNDTIRIFREKLFPWNLDIGMTQNEVEAYFAFPFK